MSWGITTYETLELAQKFFKQQPFCLILEHDSKVDFDLSTEFSGPDLDTEMHIDLTYFQKPTMTHNVIFKKVSTFSDFKLFVEISSTIFSIPYDDMFHFMDPIRGISCCFLAFSSNECVGTAQFYLDDYGFAGLQTIGVLEHYRRKGIGSSLTNLCLSTAQQSGAKIAGLTASEQGVYLYTHLGFKPIEHWKIQTIKPRVFNP